MPKRKRKMYYHTGGDTGNIQQHIEDHNRFGNLANIRQESATTLAQMGPESHFLTQNIAGQPLNAAVQNYIQDVFTTHAINLTKTPEQRMLDTFASDLLTTGVQGSMAEQLPAEAISPNIPPGVGTTFGPAEMQRLFGAPNLQDDAPVKDKPWELPPVLSNINIDDMQDDGAPRIPVTYGKESREQPSSPIIVDGPSAMKNVVGAGTVPDPDEPQGEIVGDVVGTTLSIEVAEDIMREAYLLDIFDGKANYDAAASVNGLMSAIKNRISMQEDPTLLDARNEPAYVFSLNADGLKEDLESLMGTGSKEYNKMLGLLSTASLTEKFGSKNNPTVVASFPSQIRKVQKPEQNLASLLNEIHNNIDINENLDLKIKWRQFTEDLENKLKSTYNDDHTYAIKDDRTGYLTVVAKNNPLAEDTVVGNFRMPTADTPYTFFETGKVPEPKRDEPATIGKTYIAQGKDPILWDPSTQGNPPDGYFPITDANTMGWLDKPAAFKAPDYRTFVKRTDPNDVITIDINDEDAELPEGYISTANAEVLGLFDDKKYKYTLPNGEVVEVSAGELATLTGVTPAQQATIDHNNALLEETANQNDLTNAYRNTKMAADNAFRQAELAESQGQFDRSLALQAFGQQNQAEATRINAQLQLSQQNIQRLAQITDALSKPSDAVAASFALTGQQSPMGIFTQADAINPYIADMMDQRSAIEAFGSGFQAEDFLAGRGKRQDPQSQDPGRQYGHDEEVHSWNTDTGTYITYGSGETKFFPKSESLSDSSSADGTNGTDMMKEHGGHSFGNPIIVGDSSDDKENQELVMSFGNAPMVVLPLNERQQKIMADANRNIPRAENGYPHPSEVPERNEGGEYIRIDPVTGLPGPTGDIDWSKVDSGPVTTAPRTTYSTRDYGIGGQPMNQGTISAQQAAFAPMGRRDAMGNPGLAGFEDLYPLTQGMIQQRSDLLTSPRVRRVLQGTAGEGTFRQMPTQMPFALPTPGFLRNLSSTERDFLKSNLATRNIFLDDVETAVAQRFGRTNTRTGRRRF